MQPVYDGRRSGARSSAPGVLDRGRLIASLVVVLTALSWVLLAVPANAAGVPTNISPPTISGTPQEGQTLIEVHGSWANQPTSYSYHWQRCDSAGGNCAPISGATARTYALTGVDVGNTIVVKETAKNAAGAGKPASSAPTAVVTASTTKAASVTTLLTSPTAPVVNEAVMLVAAVNSSDIASVASGAVRFLNGGSAIAGCANVPVNPAGQSVIATCQTWFAAFTAQLSAVFSPGAGGTVSPSTSPTVSLIIGQDATSTSVYVSNSVGVGASTTYAATVSASPGRLGTLQPTGTVTFFDAGQPIGTCRRQLLTNAGATCTVTYDAPGSHSISAQYGGDANFRNSSAPVEPVTVVKLPARVLGLLTPTMQWTFDAMTGYTKVITLLVNGASGATVTTTCHGRGCPFTRRATLVTRSKSCARSRIRTCPGPGTIDVAPGFVDRRLAVGAQITVAITRPGWIGKYYRFTVRAHRPPRVQIACLAPGSVRPGVSCRGGS